MDAVLTISSQAKLNPQYPQYHDSIETWADLVQKSLKPTQSESQNPFHGIIHIPGML